MTRDDRQYAEDMMAMGVMASVIAGTLVANSPATPPPAEIAKLSVDYAEAVLDEVRTRVDARHPEEVEETAPAPAEKTGGEPA